MHARGTALSLRYEIDIRAIGDITAPGWVGGWVPVVVCGEGLLLIDQLVDDATGESPLPLARFRTRFG